jgi:ubiquinone/menaquinone biosynthesis C-methylase UbiE
LQNWEDIPPQASILDLACGTGELARLLLANNPQQQITGVDISEAMLKKAEAKLQTYPNVNLYKTSATLLPFADQSFDIVICANAFHYFDAPQLVLSEIKRVLQPNSKLIILDWCRDYLWLKILDTWLKITDSAYQKCYTQAELNQLLMAAEFEIIKNNKVRWGIIWKLMAVTAI